MDPARAIVITGPVGAGKTTASQALCSVLVERGHRVFLADMDYLRAVLPAPEGDAFGAELGYRNLAAMWPHARETGASIVILPDILEYRDQRHKYELALPGLDVMIIRLNVPMDIVIPRLERRQGDDRIEWFRARAPELQEIMEREAIGDVVLSLTNETPQEVAELIAEACGLS